MTTSAQTLTKPIRLIVPYAAGGPIDATARILAERVKDSLGTVIIDNRPGAGGNIGADAVAKANTDGSVIGIAATATHAVNPWLYKRMPYNAATDFSPVTQMLRVPNVLVMNADNAKRLNIHSLQDFLSYARNNPGKLNYGSGGNGSAAHLAMEYFKLSTQTFVVHVPYRGTAPSVSDAVAGQIQMVFTGAPALIPMIKAGKLRAIAVSSPKRLDSLPDVPTVAESGLKGLDGFEADQWYGLVAPAGTPAAVVQKLNQVVNANLAAPEMMTRLKTEGATGTPTSPEAFGQLIQREIKRWRPVVLNAKITAD